MSRLRDVVAKHKERKQEIIHRTQPSGDTSRTRRPVSDHSRLKQAVEQHKQKKQELVDTRRDVRPPGGFLRQQLYSKGIAPPPSSPVVKDAPAYDWVPEQYRFLNLEKDYTRIGYQLGQGSITQEQAQQQIRDLTSKRLREGTEVLGRIYYSRYGRFGEDGKTWSQLKRETPALYMRKDIGTGDISISYEPETYMRYQYQREDWNPVSKFIRGGSASILHGVFNPEFYYEQFTTGKGSSIIAQKDYEMLMAQQKKDIQGQLGNVLSSSAYTNVVYPYAIGFGLGKTFGLIGAAGKASTGTLSRVLTGFSRKAPWVIGGAAGGVYGASIGYEAAVSNDPMRVFVTRGTEFGMRLGIGYAGVKAASTPRTTPRFGKEVYIKMGPKGNIEAIGGRKYIDIMGHQFHYGPKYVSTSSLYSGMGKSPVWEPTLGSHPSSIYDVPSRMSPDLQVSQFDTYSPSGQVSKIYMGTGKEWQPQTGFRWLPSTYVAPKPMPYWYNLLHKQFIVVVDFSKYFGVSIKPFGSPSIKSIKGFGAKGIIKDMGRVFSTKESKLDMLGSSQTQASGQKTIQLTKTKQIQVPKIKIETVKQQDTLKAREQVSMKHPLYGTEMLRIQQQSKVSMQHPLYGTRLLKGMGSLLGLRSGYMLGQVSLLGSQQLQLKALQKDFIRLQLQEQLQAQDTLQGLLPKYGFVQPTIAKSVYDVSIPKVSSFKQVPFRESYPYKPSPKPFMPLVPDDFSKKFKKQLGDLSSIGRDYRYRRWKTPTVKQLLGW